MKFSMTMAWNEAMTMFRANREVLLIVAGIFFFLPSLLVSMAVPGLQEQMVADPEQLSATMATLWVSWGWLFALVMLAQMVGFLALLSLLRDHARPTVGEALKAGLTCLLPAIGTYLLVIVALSLVLGLLIGLGMATGSVAVGAIAGVLAFVLFVYLSVKLSLAGPVIALDKVLNPFMVIARSWKLTKGNSFRLFGFYALLTICYLVISIVVSIPVMLGVMALGETAGVIVNGLVSGAISAVVTVVFVAILASIHRQLSGPSDQAIGQVFE